MSTNENKVLVFGFSGQVATALRRKMPGAAFLSSVDVDVRSNSKVIESLNAKKPQVIINATAFNQVDLAETDRENALAVNTTAVEIMAGWAAKNKAHFIHYSTDYVFDGQKTSPYREDDQKNPLSYYGLTKSLGEDAIVVSGGSYHILRVSWVYSPWAKNFLKTMLKLGSERKELTIVSDQYGAPTSAEEIAAVTHLLAERNEAPGIYHFTGGGETTWYDFAQEIFQQAKRHGLPLAVQSVKPILAADYPTPAKRPRNSRLDCQKVRSCFGVRQESWQESVRKTVEAIAKG